MSGKRVFGVLLVLLMVCPVVFAKKYTIVRTDGRKITGDVVKTDTGYKVITKFGEIIVPNDEIRNIELAVSVEDEYTKKRELTDLKNIDQLYHLGEWAFSKGLYKQAQRDLYDTLKLEKEHIEARLLLKQVNARLKAKKKAEERKKDKPTANRLATKKINLKNNSLVSQEDIYRIRMIEARPGEKLRIKFRNDVINRFIESVEGTGDFTRRNFERDFRRSSPFRQYQYMVQEAQVGPDIRNDILIESDPQLIRDFRMQVWPLIAKGCASSACHGSTEGMGGFKLFNISLKDDRVLYTNFAILVGYVFPNGEHLVKRGEPDLSPLLLYGLPKRLTGPDSHPAEIRPMYPNRQNPNFRRVETWLFSLYGPDYPNYDLTYVPPVGMKLDLSGITVTALKNNNDEVEIDTPTSPSKDEKEKKQDVEEEEKPSLFE